MSASRRCGGGNAVTTAAFCCALMLCLARWGWPEQAQPEQHARVELRSTTAGMMRPSGPPPPPPAAPTSPSALPTAPVEVEPSCEPPLRPPPASPSTSPTVGNRARLTVAVVGLWGDTNTILGDMHVLARLLFEASGGRPVVAAPSVDAADVVLVGVLGPAPAPVLQAARARGAVTIYFTGENDAHFMPADKVDHFVDVADVSLGMRAELERPNYLRAPIWMFYPGVRLGDGDTFVMPPDLTSSTGGSGGSEAAAWRARPRFAALVARNTAHGARPALLALFDRLRRRGRVRLPSGGQNMPWPACLPNNDVGKIAFFRTVRFALVPENSVTPWGGYTTEKLMHAHRAGAVPVYWGDWPPDPHVFNVRRAIHFDGTPESGTRVARIVASLEDDAAFRAAWFAEPALAPGADAWLTSWVRRARALLRGALAARGKLAEGAAV